MPPLKSVTRLEKLCSTKFADHLFTVFSSWYKARDSELTRIHSDSEVDRTQCGVDEVLPDFSDCYRFDNGQNDMTNRWFYNYLVDAKMVDYNYDHSFELPDSKSLDVNVPSPMCLDKQTKGKTKHDASNQNEVIGSSDNDCMSYEGDISQRLNVSDSEDMEEDDSDDSLGGWEMDDTSISDCIDKHALTPVPTWYQTDTPFVSWLSTQVRNFLVHNLPPRFFEEILETLINMIALKVEIPRLTEKMRNFEEDFDFIKYLGFLLNTSLKCLFTKDVTSLDFTSVAHLIKKWKLLCVGFNTVRGRDFSESPYFDIFDYALDISLPGLRTLKHLKLPHFVHNSLIRKVAFLCPNLEVLILRCSVDCTNPKQLKTVVTNLDLLHINSYKTPDQQYMTVHGCQKLVTLLLPEGVENTDINSDVIEMFSCMPNLQYFIGAPMMNVLEEMKHVYCIGDILTLPNRMTNFHHGAYDKFNWPQFVYESDIDNTYVEFLSERTYVSEVFKDVKEVGLYAPAEVTDLLLKYFTKVKDITIFTDEFEIHGKYLVNLTSLDINIGYQMIWPILTSLSQSSPNIERLTVRSFSLQLTVSDNPELRFSSLHTLRFEGLNVLEGNALMALLQGCPVLSTFVLSMLIDYDGDQQLDNDILNQALPMLSKLQKFVYKVQCPLGERADFPVPSSKLTVESFWSLINGCPQLTYIGRLETWKVTKEELDQLHRDVKKRNWDIQIG